MKAAAPGGRVQQWTAVDWSGTYRFLTASRIILLHEPGTLGSDPSNGQTAREREGKEVGAMATSTWRFEDPFGEFMQRWWDLAANMMWPHTAFASAQPAQAAGRFPVNVYEDGANYYLTALLPGVSAESLEVKTEGNVLTITGRYEPHAPDGATPLLQEMGTVQFQRQFTLGAGIDPEGVNAHYQNGVLSLVIAKAAHSRARRIPISSGAPQQQITAGV